MANAGYITSDPHYGGAPVAKVASYSSAPLVSQVYSSVGAVEKQIFTPSYVSAAPVVKSLSAYATPVQSYAVEPKQVYEHQPQYAYDPHHHIHSHTQAYPVAAKTIEYAPATHVTKTIEYAPSHAVASYGHAHHHGAVSHYGHIATAPVAVAAAPITVAHAPQYAHPGQYAHAGHYAHASPAAHYAHASPAAHYEHVPAVIAKTAVAYSPADAVAHATFQSNHAHYSW